MTLKELSEDYRAHAAALRGRIAELKAMEADTEWEQDLIKGRIDMLTIMWREARDLAVLTRRYYERGYCRNARYTL